MPDEGLIREIEQFLFQEARLLDTRRFHEWLQLFTDDVHYWMRGRSNRYPRSSKAITMLDPERYVEEDMSGDVERGLFDEDIRSLTARVARLDTGMAWAEDPPSRTRHLITNIEVLPGAS
ncbi:MAG: aromatic-ring-hydroxylating dioxygenase subunit beta, partial [Acetobacteraceae bacterium]